MSEDKSFVDTNILVYAHDLAAGQKHQTAKDILIELWNRRTGVLSVQVLQEFYITLTRKITNPLPSSKVRNLIRDYLSWHIEINNPVSILTASRIEEKYKLSFWDALIVAAAIKAKASKILSEDFKSGRVIEGILIENPFRSSP